MLFKSLLSLESISWKYKVAFITLLPILITIISSLVFSISMLRQNDELRATMDDSNARRQQAGVALVEILQFQTAIQKLIASDDKSDIRQSAIAVIKVSSLVDESMQLLQDKMPDNKKVDEFIANFEELKPQQLKIIKLAKKNKDSEAIAAYKATEGEVKKAIDLSQEILLGEEERFDKELDLKQSDNKNLLAIVLSITAIVTVLSVVLAFIIARFLISALSNIQDAMGRFANGDCDINLTYDGSDEVGQSIDSLRRAVTTTKDIVGNIRKESASLNTVSEEVFKVSKLDMEQAETMATRLEIVTNTMNDLISLSNQVDSVLENSSGQAKTSAESCQTAAGNVQDSLQHSSKFMVDLDEVVNKTSFLHESVSTISELTSTIRGISEQTNLLALNAAIEAARAGELGRGFAVVADEVRSLAGRTGEAVEKISSIATAVTTSVNETLSAIQNASEVAQNNITSLEQTASYIASAETAADSARSEVSTLYDTNKEQRSTIQKIHSVVDEVSSLSISAKENVFLLENLSSQLTNSSSSLSKVVNHFKS